MKKGGCSTRPVLSESGEGPQLHSRIPATLTEGPRLKLEHLFKAGKIHAGLLIVDST